ncbi:MAG: DUF1735 and LamG domain-containing protein [Muribaculaceae bacterium]|nr:DUF1735 and LamG domain-containing protein [Muribaculaceae bacterium]
MNIIKSIILAAPFALIGLTSCNSEGDKFDYDKNLVYVTGTEIVPVVRFAIEDTPSSYALTASSTHKATSDVHVKFAVDYDALENYNKVNGTSLNPLPQANFELSTTEGVIKAGTSFSNAIDVTITSTEGLEDALVYAIPVTITQCNELDILEPSKTIILQLARTLQFTALNLSNTGMYSNFIFDEPIELTNYTYEVKFYSETWHSIARLMNFCESDESNQSMFRFGEGGYPVNSLQWVTPSGVSNLISNTLFDTNRWYTISVTYDGSNFTLYVDGNKDSETAGSAVNGVIKFQRIELGMSWTSYPGSQYFRGRIAEIRVWDRPLGSAEIKGNLCGAKSNADGLVGYWKLNEGEGHVFHDATANGHDMDWSKSQREKNEGQGLVTTPEAANNVAWTSDDKNKCAQ